MLTKLFQPNLHICTSFVRILSEKQEDLIANVLRFQNKNKVRPKLYALLKSQILRNGLIFIKYIYLNQSGTTCLQLLFIQSLFDYAVLTKTIYLFLNWQNSVLIRHLLFKICLKTFLVFCSLQLLKYFVIFFCVLSNIYLTLFNFYSSSLIQHFFIYFFSAVLTFFYEIHNLLTVLQTFFYHIFLFFDQLFLFDFLVL